MRHSSVPPISPTYGYTNSSRRCVSADVKVDAFRFPDGREFILPSAWGVKQYITQNPRHFRTSSYRCLQPGNSFQSESGNMPFSVPEGSEVVDLSLKMIERPERCSPSSEEWFVDKDRLFSVLNAMVFGQPLPPINVEETDSGTLRVANGFHRYYASIILGYLEVPVLRKTRRPNRSISSGLDSKVELRTADVWLLEDTDDEGGLSCVKACMVAPKTYKSTLQGKSRHQIAQDLPCRPRYEPPAVRRERERKEELERRRRELAEKSSELKKTVFCTLSRERCKPVQKSKVTYVEKITGRTKPCEIPEWKDEPPLPKTDRDKLAKPNGLYR